MTIKIENGKYYAVFNIETEIQEFSKTNEFVRIDLGIRTLATLDNGLKIANLDLTYEENIIKKYQKKTIPKKIQQQPLQRHTKNLLEMDRQKKEQNNRLLPQKSLKNTT